MAFGVEVCDMGMVREGMQPIDRFYGVCLCTHAQMRMRILSIGHVSRSVQDLQCQNEKSILKS